MIYKKRNSWIWVMPSGKKAKFKTEEEALFASLGGTSEKKTWISYAEEEKDCIEEEEVSSYEQETLFKGEIGGEEEI